jgi:predicted permease
LHLTGGVAAGLVLAYVALAAIGLLAWLIGSRVLRLPRASVGTLVCTAVLANTGYLGLPLTSAVLGHHTLPAAIAFDALVSGPMFYVVGFAIGAAFGERPGMSARARVRQLTLRNPPLLAAVAGLALPGDALPDGLVTAAHDGVWGLLVLGFFVLGVTLAAEGREGELAFPPALDAQVGTALALRLVAAPGLYLALTALLVHVPAAYRVEAAMPVGINTLVVAHASGLDLRLAASAIAWSTLIVAGWGLVVGLAGS